MAFAEVLKYALNMQLDLGIVMFKPVYFVFIWFASVILKIILKRGE